MSLRSKLNANPLITGGVVVVVIVVAVVFMFTGISSSRPSVLPMFLSTDNGATWFESMTGELPPVKQPDGKLAVRVYLFKCGDDGKPFVGYLERYTDEAKAILDQARTGKGNMSDLPKFQAAAMSGLLAKRPSDKEWTAGIGASAIKTVSCPDKTRATPVTY